MEIVIKLSQFLLSLSLLIILHELGHFIPAKLFKTRVEKFYLFFDVKFSLFKKQIGETVYGIGWLPLGGYVKISGMIDESMDTEQMALPPQPWEFRSKPAWQRLIIMLGGVTVNFVLAFLIYIGMAYAYGDITLKNSEIKEGLAFSKTAEQIGFRTGDKIVALDGEAVLTYNEILDDIVYAKKATIERNGARQDIDIPVNIFGRLVKDEKQRLISLRQPFVVSQVPDTSANFKSLKAGDIITSINGKATKYSEDVMAALKTTKTQSVPANVLRDNKTMPVTLQISEKGKLGIVVSRADFKSLEKLGYYHFDKATYGFFAAIPEGLKDGKDQIGKYLQQLKAIFTPKTGAYEGVGGFGAIYNIFPQAWDWEVFWNITAFLSIMLGVMNLLPIPALDGGHVMFLLYEMVSGRKPSDKFLERAQMVGIVLLLALILFANGNDIYKWITR
ncbi:MAG: RIP metalloprotease RseP [Flavobacterium sp. BFFFF1]|uniref:RIP metalloprotease RseP n=1 Tax=Flavobacterium sp. BFFFF1 TaxID=2015557 RepID=UPI000BD1771F|nr:RIP metalloprotease RseP [Flavobacterium sp. BFFFF1]OYU80893.1 MAG: RIP metalloprotease RseP [Flavobacterium sp. BFFFF1]